MAARRIADIIIGEPVCMEQLQFVLNTLASHLEITHQSVALVSEELVRRASHRDRRGGRKIAIAIIDRSA
jgi:hypothetical protein